MKDRDQSGLLLVDRVQYTTVDTVYENGQYYQETANRYAVTDTSGGYPYGTTLYNNAWGDDDGDVIDNDGMDSVLIVTTVHESDHQQGEFDEDAAEQAGFACANAIRTNELEDMNPGGVYRRERIPSVPTDSQRVRIAFPTKGRPIL